MSGSESVVGNLSIIALIVLLVIGILGLVIYFVPTIVAVKRNHVNKVPIILVNIFFGWSLIGWILSLVWACSSSNSKTVIINNPYPPVNNPYPQANNNSYPPVNNQYPPVNNQYPPVNNPYQPANNQYSPVNNTNQPVSNNQYTPVNNANQPVNNNAYPPAGNSDTVTAKLQELSKLRADGVISEEEFQAKRAEILSRF